MLIWIGVAVVVIILCMASLDIFGGDEENASSTAAHEADLEYKRKRELLERFRK